MRICTPANRIDRRGRLSTIETTGPYRQHPAGQRRAVLGFPPENATGNYVKIVRRVPVKIDIDSGMPDGQTLPLGLSAEASVDERGAAKH